MSSNSARPPSTAWPLAPETSARSTGGVCRGVGPPPRCPV